MKKTRVISPAVAEAPPGLWSNCLMVGSMAYLSGLTSRAPDGKAVLGSNEYEQAKITFQKMKDLITAAGGVMDDIVQMTIFVTDIKQNREVWAARKEFFTGDYPACALVEVSSLASPEVLVEIQSTAHIGCSAKA
ncbi:RidA family protein [Pusillimonas noertemannii]|uniref:RidA family protein n=1 Tax=Pusillimonas noertemannii TaxID=305977 RepID=UPI0004746E06|nr:RidA family protein [Pusillimonas noertemannii]